MKYKWLLLSFCWAFALVPAGQNSAFAHPEPATAPYSAGIDMHPFYIAVTEINHNVHEKSLEITCKVFAEDIEQAIEKQNNTQLDILSEKDKEKCKQLLPGYFNRNLSISVDGRSVPLKFLGFETEKESTYCYFEVANVSSLKKIVVANTILFDFTDKQINIMHVTVNGTRKSTKLDYPENEASFSF